MNSCLHVLHCVHFPTQYAGWCLGTTSESSNLRRQTSVASDWWSTCYQVFPRHGHWLIARDLPSNGGSSFEPSRFSSHTPPNSMTEGSSRWHWRSNHSVDPLTRVSFWRRGNEEPPRAQTLRECWPGV